MNALTRAPCPTCRTLTVAIRSENPTAPFCSTRCKLVDLGRWLDESYGVPAPLAEDEDELESLPVSNARRGDT
ncbi:MAG: DNA gyrase inhibitor YacG [Deltaproteobacteria bacterium]|nr:DNA gyrase inhibitor YacG [Deltaproteobacteria bacterium]